MEWLIGVSVLLVILILSVVLLKKRPTDLPEKSDAIQQLSQSEKPSFKTRTSFLDENDLFVCFILALIIFVITVLLINNYGSAFFYGRCPVPIAGFIITPFIFIQLLLGMFLPFLAYPLSFVINSLFYLIIFYILAFITRKFLGKKDKFLIHHLPALIILIIFLLSYIFSVVLCR
jgi:hypothetical protein